MTRLELIHELQARRAELGFRDAARLVDHCFAALAEALAAGERIELRGFGSFGVRHHEARTGRNPRTGAAIAVAAKGVPYFRAAKQLRAEVNRAAQTAPARAIG